MKVCNYTGWDSLAGLLGSARCLLFYGEESYLKQQALQRCREELAGGPFAAFNLVELEGAEVTADQLADAVESCPVMSETKLVILRDLDVMKPPAALKEVLLEMLSTIPDFCTVIVYYDVLPYKPDRRSKMHAWVEKNALRVSFEPLDNKSLCRWVEQQLRQRGCAIGREEQEHLLFLCGNSMTNLLTEIEKIAAFTRGRERVTREDLDTVCVKTLDAVLFDLTDRLAEGRYDRAVSVLRELLAQRQDPIVLLASISAHLQKLYAVKLARDKSEQEKMALLGTRSSYYVRKMQSAAQKVTLPWLRRALLSCAQCDLALKGASGDREKTLELLLLKLYSLQEGKK